MLLMFTNFHQFWLFYILLLFRLVVRAFDWWPWVYFETVNTPPFDFDFDFDSWQESLSDLINSKVWSCGFWLWLISNTYWIFKILSLIERYTLFLINMGIFYKCVMNDVVGSNSPQSNDVNYLQFLKVCFWSPLA